MASNFEFYSPTRVIFGKGTEQRVGALVREYGGTRVLNVYGGKSAVRSGVLDRAEKSLAEAGISSWTLGGVVPNPHLDKVYEGMVVGYSPAGEDITVNVCKTKHLSNTRASGSDDALRLVPVSKFSLEESLEFLKPDELLEVTPSSIRIRKRILNHDLRMKATKGGKNIG